ncbi:MAG TPA: FIST N-terminal domain-containing protein, partial [Anaeromyxobacteraceae bacterium]|nr:FIST N-terminal domain-containing protein [Anaeromyxobacteraceae bacterium]
MARLTARRGYSLSTKPADAARELRAAIDQPGMRVVLLFCSPSYDLSELGAAIRSEFACPVIGCTSAGQIGPTGYQPGGIAGASLASDELEVHSYLVSPLSRCRDQAHEVAAHVKAKLRGAPASRRAFGLILVDGLSLAEEALTSTLYQSLGNVPIVGGSAGDDLRFESTAVYWEGEFLPGVAVFSVFETTLPFRTFKLHDFRPTDKKLVTTASDPSRRLVKEMNGFPAADAYAELIGIPWEELNPKLFSRNPMMLRIGSDYYLRSIQTVNPDRSLTFYAAIEEGLVLRLGQAIEPISA